MDPELATKLVDLLAKFVEAVLLLCAPVAATYIIRGVRSWSQAQLLHLKDVNPQLYAEIEAGAKMAVQAAEQLGLVAAAKQMAFDKKEYAVNALQAYLDSKGFKNVDLRAIDAAVESAVYNELTIDRDPGKLAGDGKILPASTS